MIVVSSELCRVVVSAEGFERGCRLLEDGKIVGFEDLAEYVEDIAREQRKVARASLDQGFEDLKCNLDVSASYRSV